MTHANGWPDKERPGYPKDPGMSGWHWLKQKEGNQHSFPVLWMQIRLSENFPYEWLWVFGSDDYWQGKEVAKYHTYLGSCPTPDELTALLRAERERCAKVCEAEKLPDFSMPEQWHNNGCKHSASAIRSLPDEPPCTRS
ncbi:hypothetical protein GOB93_14110 [Acetobacter musti]|uniref:Uncharacterized protein n=1 Tax=Acetobacter musti TaxID=864732 RepID=A0ABX0JSH6_9PROT|nr:hypothetical protein [Acetobacter musti]NHN85767.1 hypothetical protein [Acetobacter musti]